MKKGRIIFVTVIVVILCLSIGISVGASNDFPGQQTIQQIGNKMEAAVKSLLNKDQSLRDSDTVIGVVLGEEISREYFDWEYNLCKAVNPENPAQRAWNLIKREVYERQLAEKEGFLPTEQEIKQCSDEMRAIVESTEDSHALIISLTKQWGITEDEYWNDYQAKYEAPLQLIRGRVNEYLEKNNLGEIQPETIDGEIYDMEYFNSLE